jgi:hypothetical protein
MEAQPSGNSPGPQDEAVARLTALAAELDGYGWTASMQAKRGGPPSLHARNPVPGAGALSEHIHARPDADGNWAYWWPWADMIAHAPDDAAWIIVSALRPAGDTIGMRAGSAPGPADLDAALQNAEQFLLRTGSLHADLAARTLFQWLSRYRQYLWAVVNAGRQRPDSLGT